MTVALKTAFARALCVCAALAALSAEAAVPPAPTRWATDQSGFLSAGALQSLDSKLEAYQRSSGHHVLVWITRTAGGVPVEDFANNAFHAWRVGRKGIDDGVVLFVFADDRKVRIEVGYGLEGVIPDAIASRIIQGSIVPKLRAGDRDGAVEAGVEGLLAAIEGRAQASAPAPATQAPRPSARAAEIPYDAQLGERLTWAFWILLILGFTFFATKAKPGDGSSWLSSDSSNGGWSSSSSGDSSSSDSGGSSYSGGGGDSGGGGATGDW